MRYFGFVGTSRGMSDAQVKAVRQFVRARYSGGGWIGRHGDGLHRDKVFHNICVACHIPMILHPPTIAARVGDYPLCRCRDCRPDSRRLPARDYPACAIDLVKAVDELIVAPSTEEPKEVGCTWRSYHRALRRGIPVHLVGLDGEVREVCASPRLPVPVVYGFVRRAPSAREVAFLAEFEALWQIYPRHVGKGAARIACRRALKKTDLETVTAGVVRYARERAGQDKTFTCHMATWLNQEGWADEEERAPRDDARRSPPARLNGHADGSVERTVQEVLEDAFAGLGDPSRRARHFLAEIMPKARELSVRGATSEADLARCLAAMQLEIGRMVQAATPPADFAQGSTSLLWQYLDWISGQGWADYTASVFVPTSKSFSRWRAEMAAGDPLGRDPITGRSGRT